MNNQSGRSVVMRRAIYFVVLCGLIGTLLGYLDVLGAYHRHVWSERWNKIIGARESKPVPPEDQVERLENLNEYAKNHLGEQSDEYIFGLARLTELLVRMNDWTRANLVAQESVDVIQESFGEESPIFGDAMTTLGAVELMLGRTAEAERTFTRVVRSFAPGNMAVAGSAVAGLSTLYHKTGRLAESEILREYLVTNARIGASVDAGSNARQLAAIYFTKGKYRQSEETLKEALSVEGRSSQDPEQLLPIELELLGKLAMRTQRFEDAIRYFSVLADTDRGGAEKPTLVQVNAIAFWATALIELNRHKEATALLVRISPDNISIESDEVASLVSQFYSARARAYAQEGRAREAEQSIVQARGLIRIADDVDVPDPYFEGARNVALAFRTLGKPEAASSILIDFLEEVKAEQSEVAPWLLAQISMELARCLNDLNDDAGAKKWAAEGMRYGEADRALQLQATRVERNWEDVERAILQPRVGHERHGSVP